MKNSYLNFTDFLKDLNNSNNNNSNTGNKACLNGDFCLKAPKNRNDGILTMAFVDMQPLDSVYSLSDGFSNGTIFPNLNKPFFGGKAR